jgi:hypothetical protein
MASGGRRRAEARRLHGIVVALVAELGRNGAASVQGTWVRRRKSYPRHLVRSSFFSQRRVGIAL